MISHLPASIFESGIIAAIAGITAAIVVRATLTRRHNLDEIPTVGPTNLIGRWWYGVKFLTQAPLIIQEGYGKHKGTPFKVAEGFSWIVIISGREKLEELRSASDDQLSFIEASNDSTSTKYTMGRGIFHNPIHLPITHSQLTRSIGAVYPEIRDEIVSAFEEVLDHDLEGNEWKSVPAVSVVQQVVCRTSNRVFVGLPMCRDPDWIDLNIQYTINIIKGKAALSFFPNFLKPLAAPFVTSYSQDITRGMKLMGPMIEERLKCINEYRDEWVDKPNDVLSWVFEEAEGPDCTVKFLTEVILAVNFLAIHTSSNSFAHALLYLASNPQYIQPLREEVEAIVEKEGWSKASLGKMRRIDSFLKECQRMEGILTITLHRKALKDFTFSDGTFIPKGTMVAAPTRSLHYDDELYANPEVFNPFRFSDMRDGGGEGAKHQYVSTSVDYLAFGHGKQACPGRFFAAAELKTMLAHVVTAYDVKLEDNATRPPSLWIGHTIAADHRAKVMFRRRAD